jgi:type I restriction enzyme, S subunit
MSSDPVIRVPTDWLMTTIGKVCDDGGGDVQTGPFGSQLHASDYVEDGVPSVMPQDLLDGRISTVSIARIRPSDRDRLSRYTLLPDDLVYARRGDLRRRALAREKHRGWLCGTGCLRIRPGEATDPRFLFYVLGHPAMQNWIDRHAVGATMPNLNTDILRKCPVPQPSLAEQRRIAAVLGALDDKIESNARRRAIHVEIIGAAFSHYILARNEQADVDGDLTSIARFMNGGAFTRSATGTGRPVLRIKELKSGISRTTVFNELDVRDENVARHHDLLFSWSGSLDVYRWHGPEALINQHIFKVLPFDGFPTWFVEGWIRHHLPEFQGIAQDQATTMGHIKRQHLGQAKVRIPPLEVIARLDAVLSSLDEQVGSLAREAKTLHAVRDELLPKLVSGEIRAASYAENDGKDLGA